MKRSHRFLLILAFVAQPFLSHAQASRALDSLFHALDTAHVFNGNVLIREKGQTIYQRSVGLSDLKTRKKHSLHSAFQIGSISKTFTAVAVMQLIQQHKLGLRDSYQKYFPDFPFAQIHIDHLLSHTSGLPDKEELFFPLIDQDSTRQISNHDIIPALKQWKKELAFLPGSKWRYCNIGYALLATLVEKISGERFGDYLTRHIFRPAGMHHSYLLGNLPGDTHSVTGYLVRHHYLNDMESIGSSQKVRRWTFNLRGLYGPTNIVSTTGDLATYATALDEHKVLSKDMLDLAFTPYRLTDGTSAAPGGEFGAANYGLGWFLPTNTQLGRIVMHTGREPGFFTFFWHDLTHHRTIILLDNAESTGFGTACKQTINLAYQTPFFGTEQPGKRSLFLPYVRTLLKEGPDAAATLFNQLKADTAHYFTDERELNELGLELLADHHDTVALEALKLATLLYPQSWNTYDSYGKALLQSGRRKEAIAMYRQSVLMFPGNLPGQKILNELTKD
ncbi:serine hydrolase domain-containing protein [Larkinella humicola]|uniref:Beta-lactamase family protein n=1 Tax=Larkinella humicola TaxID=2607654 RepID=A0A5N1J9C8_9BACT|nr:serine hydrolase domain-containing protein [Larkinella humicola]KAA9346784.1 beta-lactamase family protein [Larkinella humicola]